jgi:hypothetical protein
LIVEVGGEAKEETENGLFDARGVGFGKGMKLRGGARGTIVTTRSTGTTSSIGLHMVLPMRREDDGILRWSARGSKHFQGMKVIKLFEFAFQPEWPGINSLDFATGEAAKSIFSRGYMLRLKSTDGKLDFIGGQSEGAGWHAGTESMDGTKSIDVEKEVIVIVVVRSSKANKVKFAMNLI